MLPNMGKKLQRFSFYFFTLFLTLILEPFISEFLRFVGIDTGQLVEPLMFYWKELSQQNWVRLIAAGAGGLTVGVWLQRRVTVKDKKNDVNNATELASQAASLAQEIYQIIELHESKPPAHPDFNSTSGIDGSHQHRTDYWHRQVFDKGRDLRAEFRRLYAARAWSLIERARHSNAVSDLEYSAMGNNTSEWDVENFARLLSAISGRLTQIACDEAPDLTASISIRDA